MPTTRQPRSGSLQYAPRKRAKRAYSRIRTHHTGKDAKLSGFAGYKVGMTHVVVTENRKHSPNKGQDVRMPVTILECPPLSLISVRLYEKKSEGLRLKTEIMHKGAKSLARKLRITKKDPAKELANVKLDDVVEVRVNVATQPEKAGFGKKKPEVFELALGGSVEDQFAYAKENLGKEISVGDVFQEGAQVIVYGVTKGKGFQGPVKRFGVSFRSHKSEKGVRGPANLGPWAGNRSWTVAHAGQMGYHNRNDLNKIILKIDDKPEDINATSGFKHYGNVKSTYILVKGSVMGAPKRLVKFQNSHRPAKRFAKDAPAINYVSKTSQQGQ